MVLLLYVKVLPAAGQKQRATLVSAFVLSENIIALYPKEMINASIQIQKTSDHCP